MATAQFENFVIRLAQFVVGRSHDVAGGHVVFYERFVETAQFAEDVFCVSPDFFRFQSLQITQVGDGDLVAELVFVGRFFGGLAVGQVLLDLPVVLDVRVEQGVGDFEFRFLKIIR